MIDFLKDNWQYLVAGLSCVSILINLIVLKVRKVPLSNVIKVISLIPNLISNAEKVFPLSNEGTNKKDLVKSWFNDLIIAYGVERYSKYIDIDNLIEAILNSPERSK